ncbi:MAG: hypothetical protein LBG92_06370 [Prevotellaceae bacterium]|nr:hypothetical protein [Prevotellaceae bacterium]
MVFLFGVYGTVNCQIEDKMKNEGVVKGFIIKDGVETEGYIKAKGIIYSREQYYSAPWQFQDDIRFIPKDVFENTPKIKSKLYKKYAPKDIDAYRYEDMLFESVKYADMSSVNINMFSQRMFMRRIIDGKISVFYHYVSPPVVLVGEPIEPYYVSCAKEQVVYRKDKDGKLKLMDTVSGINLDKELDNCQYIREKRENGGYSGNQMEIRLSVIEDYNKNCD